MAGRILLVEDTRFFGEFICRNISRKMGYQVDWAQSLAEAKVFCEEKAEQYTLALLDLGLPDAPKGEVVPYVVGKGIPSIVFTGSYSEERKESLTKLGVIDYIIKDSPISLEYVVKITSRIMKNAEMTALIVGGSKEAQQTVSMTLQKMQMQTLISNSEAEGLQWLEKKPEIGITLLMKELEEGTSFSLLKNIRSRSVYKYMPVVPVQQDNDLDGNKYIKYGANDYINYPFKEIDFYTRINNALHMQDQMQQLDFMAKHDFMTGLYNRRAFFDRTSHLIAQAKRGQISLTLAIFDIDHFKLVNDTYGHDVGDIVITQLANSLKENSRATDIVARFGGEEFCAIYIDLKPDQTESYFENIRKKVEDMEIPVEGKDTPLKITISTGVTQKLDDDINNMILVADNSLYKSKETGRNKVTIEE